MGKSSKDKRDAYYRLAKEQNWRARSAFKLIQIDEEFDLFSHDDPSKCTRVVDLCAAPGSWSQVLSRILVKGESYGRRAWIERQAAQKADQLGAHNQGLGHGIEQIGISDEHILKPRKNVKIVALDLQPMSHLDGVKLLQADITHPCTVQKVLKELDPDWDENNETHRVDLVISDGAPDVTGLHDFDIYIQAQLLYSALTLSMKILRPGGKFVAKIFRGRDVDLIYAQLRLVFNRVHVTKPRSSRASSLEAFVVCQDYKPPEGWTGDIRNYLAPISTLKNDLDANNGEGHCESTPIALKQNANPPRRPLEQSRRVREDDVTELTFEDPNAENSMRWIAPFLACGDLSGFDADATYELPPGYISLDPVQPPTNPPYKAAQDRKRADGGAYGKTKYKENGKAKVSASRLSEMSSSRATLVSASQTELDTDLVPEVKTGDTVADAYSHADAKSDLAVRSKT
jgi:tRNA (cytidine32/guanosine34-2'-O)-methyltransferase